MDELTEQVARLAMNGMYEPGQYVPGAHLDTGSLTEDGSGAVSFTVWTTTPNTDRERLTVTVTRP